MGCLSRVIDDARSENLARFPGVRAQAAVENDASPVAQPAPCLSGWLACCLHAHRSACAHGALFASTATILGPDLGGPPASAQRWQRHPHLRTRDRASGNERGVQLQRGAHARARAAPRQPATRARHHNCPAARARALAAAGAQRVWLPRWSRTRERRRGGRRLGRGRPLRRGAARAVRSGTLLALQILHTPAAHRSVHTDLPRAAHDQACSARVRQTCAQIRAAAREDLTRHARPRAQDRPERRGFRGAQRARRRGAPLGAQGIQIRFRRGAVLGAAAGRGRQGLRQPALQRARGDRRAPGRGGAARRGHVPDLPRCEHARILRFSYAQYHD